MAKSDHERLLTLYRLDKIFVDEGHLTVMAVNSLIRVLIRDQGFCDACTKICGDHTEWPVNCLGRRYLRLDQTFDQLRSNASRGCRFCQFRYRLFNPEQLQELELRGCDYQDCQLIETVEFGFDLYFDCHLAREDRPSEGISDADDSEFEYDELREFIGSDTHVSSKSCS